jgi:SagB-type dehydrogenase family enzyme
MTKQRRRQALSHNAGGLQRYRRSPFLISYWLGPILVFENYAVGKKVAGDPFACDILAYCDEPRTIAEITCRFPEEDPKTIQEGMQRLRKYALLELSTRQSQVATERWLGWEAWSPSASFFHFATKDVKYERGEAKEFTSLRQLAKRKPLPARRKRYPGAKRVQLSVPGRDGEFDRILKERRTWREFSKKPLDRSQLEKLLWLSFGVQGWVTIRGVGRLPLKTSPSGGALHPLESYVLIRRVGGIAPGIYHYDSEGHTLELLRGGASKREIKELLAGQDWFCDAACVIFLTAVFPRSQWKYEHPRAYRVVLAEAGHVCQTFCLTATWLGLAPFCTMAFADTEIERRLGVDGIIESVVYAMGVGGRPGRPATTNR